MVGMSRRLLACVIILALVAVLPLTSFAASTGQIKGRITDESTGDPVVGASVLVVGTKFGAFTDPDGYYQILRLEPGVYTLKISSVEYKTVEVTDVQVKIDETAEINQKMSSGVTELDETITVRGTQDILDKFVTDSRVTINQQQIQSRPVQTVDALLDQVSGVRTTTEGEVFIRGGRAGEVSYIVDGVPIDDPLGASGQIGANLSLVSGSIAEIQIIKDGFDPEYGNALSGIINIRSQTGSKDNTRFNAQYITDDLGNSSLNKFSRNFDYMRMSLSGPDPILSEKILPALGLNFMRDQEFTYYIYADMEKDDGNYPLSEYETPSTVRQWPSFNFLGFDVPERLFNRYTFQSNVKFRPRPNLKFIMSYKRWSVKSTSFSHDYWEYALSGSTLPIQTSERQSLSLEVTQQVSNNMNYEVVLSVLDIDATNKPGDPYHPGKTIDPNDMLLETEAETYTDVNRNGVYDAPEPILNLFPDQTGSYGNFLGPEYTYGELGLTLPGGSGGNIPVNFRFNGNGYADNLQGEPFLDLNGNGIWDAGDVLQDKNGNGIYDRDRISNVGQPTREPFIDGDSIIGEPFSDVNQNGIYESDIDIFVLAADPLINQDLNHNGRYDGPQDPWTQGIPFQDRNGNGVYDLANGVYDPGEPFTDVNGNGIYDAGGSTFLNTNTHDPDLFWEQRSTRTWRAEVKVFRQMNRHELKGGFFVQRDEVDYGRIERPNISYNGRPDTLNPYSDRGAFRDFYSYQPFRGSVYFRDKIEYGSLIASLGLRWDFFLQDVGELENNLVADDRGGLIEGDRHKISPRIGFSYPISDKAKVYFNYGHFFQLPGYTLLYARNTSISNQNDVVGNPNLDYQKTIQYSFGVKYKMTETYSIDIEGYFKDEFDKINSGDVQEGGLIRQQYLNKDYGRSRGFEIELEKRGGGYVNGTLSYAYQFAFGKDSKTNDQFQRDLLTREPLTEAPLDNDIRHTLKSAIQIFMPSNVKPRLFGLPIPNGWSLSIETIIESGSPFTPTTTYPNVISGLTDPERNSLRLPATTYIDIRFAKEFKLATLDWQGILWVENLFDNHNVVSVYSNTGRPDTGRNEDQVVKGGSVFESNPFNWDYGRQIRLGLEVSI